MLKILLHIVLVAGLAHAQIPNAAGQTNYSLQLQEGDYLSGYHIGAGIQNLAPSGNLMGSFYYNSTNQILYWSGATINYPCFASPSINNGSADNAAVVQCSVTLESGDLTAFTIDRNQLAYQGATTNRFFLCGVESNYGNQTALVVQYNATGAEPIGTGISGCVPAGSIQAALLTMPGPPVSVPVSMPVSTPSGPMLPTMSSSRGGGGSGSLSTASPSSTSAPTHFSSEASYKAPSLGILITLLAFALL